MKQVSNAKNSLVLTSPLQHPIHQRRSFSNCVSMFLFLCIALFATSCQKESLQSISQSQDLLSSSQKQNLPKPCVPLDGKFTLSFTETGVLLNGEGSHIGRFTFFAPDGGNTSTITAANGDQIFTTYTFSAHDDLGGGMVQASLDNTITEGTGRFAGATGSFVIDALINETLGKGTGTFDGTICY